MADNIISSGQPTDQASLENLVSTKPKTPLDEVVEKTGEVEKLVFEAASQASPPSTPLKGHQIQEVKVTSLPSELLELQAANAKNEPIEKLLLAWSAQSRLMNKENARASLKSALLSKSIDRVAQKVQVIKQEGAQHAALVQSLHRIKTFSFRKP